MTTVAVTIDPPRDGLVLPALPETSPLTETEATSLYEAMAADAFLAVAESGGELLVNYRSDDDLPDEYAPADADAEAEVRDLIEAVLDDDHLEDVRVEVQVGSSKAARVGNTISHLLETEGVTSAAVLEPDAPLLLRKDIDSAAMKLRRSPVVLGPADDGHVYFAGFREPIDFTGSYDVPAVENLTARAIDAGHDVDFMPRQTRARTGDDLCSLVADLHARRMAGRLVPAYTMACVEELGLCVEPDDGQATLVRE